jgi:hypothetical protein
MKVHSDPERACITIELTPAEAERLVQCLAIASSESSKLRYFRHLPIHVHKERKAEASLLHTMVKDELAACNKFWGEPT